MSFEPNQGQTDRRVRFLARGPGYMLFLTANEAVLALRGNTSVGKAEGRSQKAGLSIQDYSPPHSERNLRSSPGNSSLAIAFVHLRLVRANRSPRIVGLSPLSARSNYFIGSDPRRWHRDLPTYARVVYQNIYPGVDLAYYGDQRQLEYDFVIAPGADPAAIRLSLVGQGLDGPLVDRKHHRPASVHVDSCGDLVVSGGGGEIRFHKPVIYQMWGKGEAATSGPVKHFVDGRYVLTGSHEVGFRLGNYDRTEPLVIDPTLGYATYLGGSRLDTGNGIAVDSSGNAYVTGETASTDFPTLGAYQDSNNGVSDAFVTKFDSTGALVYSTYLGGGGGDRGTAIAVDADGNAYVTGRTNSGPDFPPNFPTVNAYQSQLLGDFDAFVSKLSPQGDTLLYSTYFGGSGNDAAFGIAVDGLGNAYITGGAGVGSADDFPIRPTMGAFQRLFGGGLNDGFVAKFDTTQAGDVSLIYSTFLGGSDRERGNSIAVDASGNAYVTGRTSSVDFPTANAFQDTCGGCPSVFDAFVAVLDPTGSTLVYSTYLGGTGNDQGFGIAVDSAGNAYVAGETSSTDFYTLNPFQASLVGTVNAFVAAFDPTGTPLYSSYLGGTSSDSASGIALDTQGNVYVTGRTSSTDFPTANAFQDTFGGGSLDAFVAKIDSSPSLIYSSYLGGSGDENAPSTGPSGNPSGAIAVDASGNAYVTGMTSSVDFPTANTLQPYGGGPSDAFVAQISATDYFDAQQAAEKCLKPFLAHRNVTPGQGKSRSASPSGGCMETRSAHCCRLSRP